MLYEWLVASRRRRPPVPPVPARSLLGWWLVLPMAVPIALSFVLEPLFHERYVNAASTAGFILVARAITRLRLRPAWQAVIVAVLVSLHIPGLADHFRFEAKPEWREMVATLEAHGAPDDTVVLMPEFNDTCFGYYTRGSAWAKRLRRIEDIRPEDGTALWLVRDDFFLKLNPSQEADIAAHLGPYRAPERDDAHPILRLQHYVPVAPAVERR